MMAFVLAPSFGRHRAEVDIEGLGVDIDKHRSGAEPGNDTRGGEKRKRCGHHLVAVSDTERHQAGQQGVGAGRHADPEAGAAKGGDFLLKAADLGTEDEVLRGAHPVNRGPDVGRDTRILGFEID